MPQTASHKPRLDADSTLELASRAPNKMLINGDWSSGTNAEWFDVVDPSDGSKIASVVNGTKEDGLRAVSAAAAATEDWKTKSPRQRSDILMRCFHLMMERVEFLARLITAENGKALPDARGEVSYAAEFFRWYAEEATRDFSELAVAPSGTNRIVVQHQPIGIAVLVTPWNFPAAMATRKIAPALAAGCTCILKPAAETPLTALAIGEIMIEAGVPAGVVNIVTTKSAGEVVSAMLHDPRVRKVSFTGSTGVGKLLLKEAADQVISSSMELGGNAPFIVFDDADLESAVAGAMVAKMRNGGEACTAANRFYVQRGIYDKFIKRLTYEMSALKVGRGLDAGVQLGPLITPAAVAKVERLVLDAVNRGAKIVTGGKKIEGPGYFYPPTVLSDVVPGSEILNEEIFGPVAAIIPFGTQEEAIALANDTEYGLVSYIYSADQKRAFFVAGEIESGMVGINRGIVSDAAAPFGGMKQSGLGREGGKHGMLEYLEIKYIAASW